MFSARGLPSGGSGGEGSSGASSSGSGDSKTHGHFKYIVDWDDVPLSILRPLRAAEEKGERANPSLMQKLLSWVGDDLGRRYCNFRKAHIVRTKTPGMDVYRDVTTQIITDKFKTCFRVEVNGTILDQDGHQTFLKKLCIKMENKARPLPNVQKNAAIAKGAVVARREWFNPDLNNEERKSQNEMKERLQEIFHTCRESNWPLKEIDELMDQSYALQRMDIVSFAIMLEESQDEEQIESENSATGALPLCVARVKADWPFLFQPKWQALHYLQLTDNPIDVACQEFIEQHMDVLVNFLTSSSSDTAIKCLAIKAKWEQASSSAQTKFMMVFKKIVPLSSCQLRTTSPAEVRLLPGITGSPTIVALHQNIFMASKFYVCIDQQVIRVAYTSEEAMQGIIHGAFIFSTDYPNNMKHTFEYIERIVCQLGSSSQLKKPLRVVSTLVLRLVNGVQKFQERLRKLSQNI